MRQRKESAIMGSIESIIQGHQSTYKSKSEIGKYAAFFLGAELNRNIFVHPIITTRARVWANRDDKLEEIYSCRIFIEEIHGMARYVDVVSEGVARDYISRYCSYMEKCAGDLLSHQWQAIMGHSWSSDVAEKRFRVY